jgi:hypothetical protein
MNKAKQFAFESQVSDGSGWWVEVSLLLQMKKGIVNKETMDIRYSAVSINIPKCFLLGSVHMEK